jgi:hypothetical protein
MEIDHSDYPAMAAYLYDGCQELPRAEAVALIAGHLQKRDEVYAHVRELCRANGFDSVTEAIVRAQKAERRGNEVEALVRRMCQIAQENGPVAAKTHIDELMPRLRELIETK